MSTDEQKTGNECNYPSSSIIYSTIKDEYNYELQRIQTIDTKVNIGVTLDTALFIFLLDFFDFSDLLLKLEADITIKKQCCFYFVICLILLVSYICSYIVLLKIIRSRKYFHININDLIKNNLHKESTGITEMYIAVKYKDSILINREINNKRMKMFNLSLVFISIVILCSVILSIIKFNLLWREVLICVMIIF